MSRGTAKYVVRAQVSQAWLIKYCILENLVQEAICRICMGKFTVTFQTI